MEVSLMCFSIRRAFNAKFPHIYLILSYQFDFFLWTKKFQLTKSSHYHSHFGVQKCLSTIFPQKGCFNFSPLTEAPIHFSQFWYMMFSINSMFCFKFFCSQIIASVRASQGIVFAWTSGALTIFFDIQDFKVVPDEPDSPSFLVDFSWVVELVCGKTLWQ